MNILRVFFWFCREHKIMDIVTKLYINKLKFNNGLGFWCYDNGYYHYRNMDFKEYLEHIAYLDGNMERIFECLETKVGKNMPLLSNERYKNAKKKWLAFIRNNVMISEDFIKEGDVIECFDGNREMIVEKVNEKPSYGSFLVKYEYDGMTRTTRIPIFQKFKVNGEKREPKFYIKRKRKFYYGFDKK